MFFLVEPLTCEALDSCGALIIASDCHGQERRHVTLCGYTVTLYTCTCTDVHVVCIFCKYISQDRNYRGLTRNYRGSTGIIIVALPVDYNVHCSIRILVEP